MECAMRHMAFMSCRFFSTAARSTFAAACGYLSRNDSPLIPLYPRWQSPQTSNESTPPYSTDFATTRAM